MNNETIYIEDINSDEWQKLLTHPTGVYMLVNQSQHITKQWVALPAIHKTMPHIKDVKHLPYPENASIEAWYADDELNTYRVFRGVLDDMDWDIDIDLSLWIYKRGYLMRVANITVKRTSYDGIDLYPITITYHDNGILDDSIFDKLFETDDEE